MRRPFSWVSSIFDANAIGAAGVGCMRGDDHLGAGAEAATGTTQGLPDTRLQAAHQQDFHGSAGAGFGSVQPGGDDAAAVEHHQVAGTQVIGEVAEPAVLDAAVGPVAMKRQQPGRVARFGRRLGDQLERQMVIEVGWFADRVFRIPAYAGMTTHSAEARWAA